MQGKTISCFIDESGDFGPYDHRTPNYYVAMVLHDQADDISNDIQVMEQRAAENGYADHTFHVGPMIRRESVYQFDDRATRKHIFNILYYFAVRLPIRYFCVNVPKTRNDNVVTLTARISRAISREITAHRDYWEACERIIVYYDNGQTELTRIITSVFNALFSNVEMRKVRPNDYKLFQVADLICTLEMIGEKERHNGMSKSELDFFGSARAFKKDYYKKIADKRLQ